MAKRQKDILNEEQKNFLAFAATEPYLRENYYLTGGTPLTAFYLQHRYSEDLNFFIKAEEVNILAIQKLMARAKRHGAVNLPTKKRLSPPFRIPSIF